MKRIYISGPMTGYPDYNFPAFMEAEDKLRSLGYGVINPARIEHKNKECWVTCMRQAITEMMQADAVATLPGWKRSRGAQIEVELAIRLTIPVIMYEILVEGDVAYDA